MDAPAREQIGCGTPSTCPVGFMRSYYLALPGSKDGVAVLSRRGGGRTIILPVPRNTYPDTRDTSAGTN